MSEAHKTPEKIAANEIAYVKKKGIIPTPSFINKFSSIIVDCGWCSKTDGSIERIERVRGKLELWVGLTSLCENKEFTKYCLSLCKGCDYSRPKIYDLIKGLV